MGLLLSNSVLATPIPTFTPQLSTPSTKVNARPRPGANSKEPQDNKVDENEKSPQIEEKAKEPDKSLKDAESALAAQEPERALHIFEYSARKFPHDLRAAIGVARVYYILGQTDRAFKLMNALSNKYPLAAEPYAMLGNLYLGEGKFSQAYEKLNAATLLDPSDAESRFRMAQIAIINNARDEALLHTKKALEADPHFNPARVMRARLLWAKGDIDEAIVEINTAIAVDPDNPVLLCEKASLAAAKGRSPEAVEKLLQAHRLAPESAEIQKQFVTVYGSRHDWPNAQDSAVSVVQLEPKNHYSYLLLGWCALKNHEFDDALSALKEAVRLAPDDPEAHSVYGLALLERRKVDDAIAQFKAASTLNSEYLPATLNAAAACGIKGQFQQGIEQLHQLEDQFPDNQAIETLHAYMAARAGKLAEAERIDKQCLARDPKDSLALITWGIICRQKGQLKESISILQRACKLAADSPTALIELSTSFLADGNSADAIEMAQQANQLAPLNLDAKAALAFALIGQKNYDGAIFLLKECVARNPKDLPLRMILADAQLAKGEKEFAEVTLDKAKTLFPDRAEPLVGLAKIARDNHNYKQAVSLLEQALLGMPASQEILILLARIYYDMGKPEACLQQLSTINDKEMKPEDILLKARSEYNLRDFEAAAADYLKVMKVGNIGSSNDTLDLVRSLLEIGQAQKAQDYLSRIEADPKLLKECKQAQVEKLQSDLRHALVKVAN